MCFVSFFTTSKAQWMYRCCWSLYRNKHAIIVMLCMQFVTWGLPRRARPQLHHGGSLKSCTINNLLKITVSAISSHYTTSYHHHYINLYVLKHTPNNSVIPSHTRAGWILRLTQNWYVIFTISSLVFPTRM